MQAARCGNVRLDQFRADTDTKIKPILTAEQWTKLEQLRAERKAQGSAKKKK